MYQSGRLKHAITFKLPPVFSSFKKQILVAFAEFSFVISSILINIFLLLSCIERDMSWRLCRNQLV